MQAIYNTLSVAGKEIRLIVADRGTLAVLLLLPILLGSLFSPTCRSGRSRPASDQP